MLIGISGRAGVGKSTLAEVAEEHFNFKRLAFADALKEECVSVLAKFDIPPLGLYDPAHKLSTFALPKSFIADYEDFILPFAEFHPIIHEYYISYRKFMQFWGDYRRTQNKDYWLQKFMDNADFSEDLIVDDVRFFNEAALIQALGGIIVRINWPSHTRDTHASETLMDNFPMFNSVILKDYSMPLAEYKAICLDYLHLWLGDIDESPRTRQAACPQTTRAVFNRKRLPEQPHTETTGILPQTS